MHRRQLLKVSACLQRQGHLYLTAASERWACEAAAASEPAGAAMSAAASSNFHLNERVLRRQNMDR